MQSLKIIDVNNEQIELDYSETKFMLQALRGISDSPVDLLSTRGYLQDGETAIGELLRPRPIAFTAQIFGNSMLQIYERRSELIKFLNPKKGLFTIIYSNDFATRKVIGRVSGPPRAVSLETNRTALTQPLQVQIRCDNPYLLDELETRVDLAVIVPLFEFELEFAPDIRFSSLANKQITIDNQGHVNTPIRVEWRGAVTNPVLTNDTTGEFIKVNLTLLDGQVLTIDTSYGNKSVTITDTDGTEIDSFGSIDLSSTFFDLELGENLLTYSADSGEDSAILSIYYHQRYVGV